MRNIKALLIILIAIPLLAPQSAYSQMSMDKMEGMMMPGTEDIDTSSVELCDFRDPVSWRDAQVVDGIEIEEDLSCSPDMPALIAAAVKGTNNISEELLNSTGLAPDAIIKGEDKDFDGDPDVIEIHLEIMGLNEGIDPLVHYEIAPGIEPAFWTFSPKGTGMVLEGMVGAHLMRMPAPAIRIEQGDEVKLVIENTHYLRHTVHLHGVDHPFVDGEGEGNDGVPIASEMAIMPGQQRTYDINPRVAGTMAYHCHVEPDVHVLMGLNGMFIIEENRPNNTLQTINVGGGKVRHRSQTSKALYDGEYDLHYQDVDKEMHSITQGTNDIDLINELHREYDITERTPDYFLLNGKSFPYTLRESQIIVNPDEQHLLRVLNIGSRPMALHTHGHKVLIKALDGIDLPKTSQYYRDVVELFAAQRVDLILETTNDGLNSYGPGIWLFHDHDEEHITNDGIGPGGNLSMITYKSFMGEEGFPKLQGMDIKPFFTAEYYERDTNDEDDRALGILLASGLTLFAIIAGAILKKKLLNK